MSFVYVAAGFLDLRALDLSPNEPSDSSVALWVCVLAVHSQRYIAPPPFFFFTPPLHKMLTDGDISTFSLHSASPRPSIIHPSPHRGPLGGRVGRPLETHKSPSPPHFTFKHNENPPSARIINHTNYKCISRWQPVIGCAPLIHPIEVDVKLPAVLINTVPRFLSTFAVLH